MRMREATAAAHPLSCARAHRHARARPRVHASSTCPFRDQGVYADNTFDGIVINQTVQHIEDDASRCAPRPPLVRPWRRRVGGQGPVGLSSAAGARRRRLARGQSHLSDRPFSQTPVFPVSVCAVRTLERHRPIPGHCITTVGALKSSLCQLKSSKRGLTSAKICRPTRGAMQKTFDECSRILKPGGVLVISTRSKEPQYSDLYW